MRIDIGGRSLFLQCTGPGNPAVPTVLLEAELGADHSGWAQVQAAAAPYARVCSYDRAGIGQSDRASTPRDATAVADDLAALLMTSGVVGPYVVVGHSFGGLFARYFAARNPESVVGLVLVDAVSEDWWSQALAALPPESAGESQRLQSFRRFLSGGVADPARNAEQVNIPAVAEQARAAGAIGSRPLVVLTAGVTDAIGPGLPPEVQARLEALLKDELPRALAGLSTDSALVPVLDSGHNIPQQRPDAVVLAIQTVLAAVARSQ